ncbi:MAG TPA: NAD-dependent epimerase/dehydratase family protein [Kofleriaceae bacterium]|nr:NAD-dependent epimerase/dehydratase family protein [Kofleriaceae bacterium]
MNVLVTGATTPLGAAIVDELQRTSAAFVLAVGHEPCATYLHPGERVEYHSLDLTRPRSVHDLLWGPTRDHAIDTIIHLAQHRRVGDSGSRIHAQNVGATREMLLGAMEHPTIRRFIYRSFSDVYALRHTTTELIDEEAPLDFEPQAPQWVRDRVEADTLVSAHFGSRLQVAVLRCVEILASDVGSQLWDYLQSRVCLRPLGFDPMINVLSLADAAIAFTAAAGSTETGVFNIVGADTLPLSRAIEESVRIEIPVPGPLMAPLYNLRRSLAGFEFNYQMNLRRFHFGGVLDGTRAAERLGYVPQHHVEWPRPWWRMLIDRLTALRLAPQ